MSNAEFPVNVVAVYCGRAGNSGSFPDRETGEMISYSEAHAFDFDSADGNVQRLVMRSEKIDKVAEGFDHMQLQRYTSQVEIEGNVVLADGGGRSFFKPTKITLA